MKNTQDLVKRMINKMLEKHGHDYDFVLKNPEIDGVPWYSYFSLTKAEEEEYKKWAISEMKKHFKGYSPSFIEKEYSWFNLMYGLKIVG